MKQPKTNDINWSFDLECDDDTPEYVLENLLDKILEEIYDEFRKKKTRHRNGFDARGEISYAEEVEVDEDKMKGNN